MCKQCDAGSRVLIQRVIPDYSLVQATVDTEGWKAGEYGLVRSNDPDFVWAGKPMRDLTEGMTEDEFEELAPYSPQWKSFDALCDFVKRIEGNFRCSPDQGYRLTNACVKAGYDPNEDGGMLFWLMNHIAKRLEKLPQGKE